VELRCDKKMRVPLFFNLPTATKQFLVNGVLTNESASPSIGTGLQFKLFQINLGTKSKIETEIGPLASVIIDKNLQLAPIIASRVKIMRGENFLMYIGMSYAFGVNTLGMFYGTGTVF
jgi:hypothetical protein